MKKIIISIAVLVIIVIGVVYFKDTKNTSDSVLNEQVSQNNEQTEVSSIPQNSSSTTPSTILKSVTKAELAKHNKPTDCWTTINGKVYDLTAFASKHPGGDKAIFSICGIDGSKAFNNQHGGQEQPETTLKGFDIGTLVQ